MGTLTGWSRFPYGEEKTDQVSELIFERLQLKEENSWQIRTWICSLREDKVVTREGVKTISIGVKDGKDCRVRAG